MEPIRHTKGERLVIYQDPVTRKKPEGEAELVEFHHKESFAPYMEVWRVKFIGEEETYERYML